MKQLIFFALGAAFLNLIPLLLVVPAGDAVMNYMQVECFSRQLWSGIFYPRWCVDANGGMGSAGPIFYFPLPFYIAALFAPLKLAVEHQYLLGIYLANVTAFACCTLWLSRIVSRRVALFCAFLFLFGFYRAEMIARASYAEYWCVALLPLLFMLAHDACCARFRTWPKLALVLVACFFCHAPMTLIGLVGAGLYILFHKNWRAMVELAIASLLAMMVALFHYLPMKTLVHTLNDAMGGITHWRASWVNSFVDEPQLYNDHRWALIGSCVALITVLFTCAAFWHKRRTMPADAKSEGMCWIVIAGFALFMMFSVSTPLWNLIELVSGVATPWRMQSLILFALVMAIAILAEHAWGRNPKTRTGDALLGAMFFIFSSLFYMGGVDEKDIGIQKRLIPSQYSLIYFSTRDIDTRYKSVDLFFRDFIDRPNRRKAEWVRGSGALNVGQWDAHGLTISGHAEKPGTLRLEHFYYPIWQAERDGTPVRIEVEKITGRMLFEMPKGDFTLRLTQNFRAMLPPYFMWVWAGVCAALAMIGLGFYRRRV